ncbi:MAG TPA: hypothetical protein PK299_03575, partial [Anaerolineales bacterium]|nr:hypothetical protein [Anaerolineales bacterium]
MFETLKNNRKLIRLFYKLSGKQYIHFLHIGKTGGTSINHALAPYYKTDKYILVLHSHNVKLAHIPEGDKVVFFLREPISR